MRSIFYTSIREQRDLAQMKNLSGMDELKI